MAVPGLTLTIAEAAGLVFLQSLSQRIPRQIGGVLEQVTLEENHIDELFITDHPVEQNANVTDHAFKMPRQVTIRCGWSNSPSPISSGLISVPGQIFAGLKATAAAFNPQGGIATSESGSFSGPSSTVVAIYNQLLEIQNSRQLIGIVTGKQIYNNMQIKSLAVLTNRDWENALAVTAICRELILVNTLTGKRVTAPSAAQQDPASTGPTAERGAQSLQSSPGSDGGIKFNPTQQNLL